MAGPDSQRYLLIKHSEGWNVDRCALWMERSGTAVDWCYPASGEAFPDPADYSGVIIFGAASSANDCKELEWVRRELAFIELCLKHETPFFGICLGAQMLARVMGSKIYPHSQGLREVGFCDVLPTEQAGDFMSKPLKVMQWHTEGLELPAGTTRLAYSESFPNQAFSVSERVVGVQFHPEVNLDVLRLWHERNRQSASGVLDDATRAAHVADAIACEPAITQWLDGFLGNWTRSTASAA